MKKVFFSILLIFYLSCNNNQVRNDLVQVKISWDNIHIERVSIDKEEIKSGKIYTFEKGGKVVEVLYYYENSRFVLSKEKMISNIVYRKILLIKNYEEFVIDDDYEIVKVMDDLQGEKND